MDFTELKIMDAEILKEHKYLDEDDECYFFGEYIPDNRDKMHSFIMNLKKKLDQKGLLGWSYKYKAIQSCSSALEDFASNLLEDAICIPIPPSKDKSDPLYDDRLIQVLEGVDYNLDICDLFELDVSMDSFHDRTTRRLSPEELEEFYSLNIKMLESIPETIVIFDDVITTGSHFKCFKNMLQEEFPDAEIIGLFIARTPKKVNPFL